MNERLTITEKEGGILVCEADQSARYTVTWQEGEQTGVENRTRPSAPWWTEAAQQLEAIRGLPGGWDSYGSPPPRAAVVAAARDLLRCLAQSGLVLRPHVNPTPQGGVQFEWEAGPRYFELEVISEHIAQCFYSDREAKIEEQQEIFSNEFLDPVLEYIARVAEKR